MADLALFVALGFAAQPVEGAIGTARGFMPPAA
jgi:hypothetical protein